MYLEQQPAGLMLLVINGGIAGTRHEEYVGVDLLAANLSSGSFNVLWISCLTEKVLVSAMLVYPSNYSQVNVI